jgi:hypothetical protein
MIFLKTNWIPTILNLAVGFILVTIREDLTTIYPITALSALMLGVGGQAFIKKLSNIFDSKVDTVVNL